MKAARYPVAEVLWLDSAQLDRGDWMVLDEIAPYADDLLQRSIGYVVADTETSLALARSISEWKTDTVEKAEGVLCIPKVAIKERR
jgi:hypothetical protein